MNFLHTFIPDPIFWQTQFFTIRWYGLIMACAMALGVAIFYYVSRQKKILSTDDVFDISFWLLVGGVIGARLYDVFFIDWNYYRENIFEIYKIWHGGLAIHGALIGGLVAAWLWTKKKNISLLQLTDILVVSVIAGQAIGRWGNYFNQELFGWPTSVPWGIPIIPSHRPASFSENIYFHPTFLYESFLNLILCVVLWWMTRRNHKTGVITAVYVIGYGIIRFAIEFIRIDETPAAWGLRFPQWVSLFLVAIGVSLLMLFKMKKTA